MVGGWLGRFSQEELPTRGSMRKVGWLLDGNSEEISVSNLKRESTEPLLPKRNLPLFQSSYLWPPAPSAVAELTPENPGKILTLPTHDVP